MPSTVTKHVGTPTTTGICRPPPFDWSSTCYRSQAHSGRKVETRLSEDVSLCRLRNTSQGHEQQRSWSEPYEFDNDYSKICMLPRDLRLSVDDKWNKLLSWVTQTTRPRRTHDTSLLPRHCLDLSQEGHVMLVDHCRLPYAALSHRWDISQHLTLTHATMSRLRSGVPINHLPSTFKDAVVLTKRLGIYALWIDALCIVQDNAKDWLTELKKMGNVYLRAQFVSAAHCAADDSEGFLSRALAQRPAIYFDIPEANNRVCGNFDYVTHSSLSRRGWVLQERLMATQTLHFTRYGTFSETRTAVWSENGRVKQKSKFIASSTFAGPGALYDLRQILASTKVVRYSETPYDWLALVEMYTDCELTREEDKLIAIAGIADKIALSTRYRWCAGLWSDQISFGLNWLPAQSLDKPTRDRAPSWSWAAWEGAVQYPDWHNTSQRAEFHSIQTANASSLDVVWLQGPGTLKIWTKVVPLGHVVVSSDSAQLRPGPDQRG